MSIRQSTAAVLLAAWCHATSAAAQTAPPQDGSPAGLWNALPAETIAPTAAAAVDVALPTAVSRLDDSAAKPKSREWVIAPIPMINPTLDNGLAVVVGSLYRLPGNDAGTPPSLTMVAGFWTSNGSTGGALVQQFHLRRDRFRILGVYGYSDLHYDYFGTGSDQGREGVSIPLDQKGSVGLADALVLVGAKWYLGARYQFMDSKVNLDTDRAVAAAPPQLPAADLLLKTAGLGPRLLHDTRDNPFYPATGSQFNALATFFAEDLGGRRSYQTYQGWFSQYFGLGERQVMAWRAAGCGTAGSVPFYDLCQLGKSQDLRGYVVGQYRDRVLLAAQAEYRAQLWRRVGGVLFAGAGGVAPAFDRFTADDVLPGAGVGLRYILATRNHVNLRVDYAWGKASRALYISVGEAF